MQIEGIVFLLPAISPAPRIDIPPQEENRVRHPHGFSIIRPGRTKASFSEDGIGIVPDGGRSRYTESLVVHRLAGEPDRQRLEREGLRPGTFQDRDAFIRIGPSGRYDTWRAIINRGGWWYEIYLMTPASMELWQEEPTVPTPPPSPEWMAYLNTLRVDE
jgi:hypothetical protein